MSAVVDDEDEEDEQEENDEASDVFDAVRGAHTPRWSAHASCRSVDTVNGAQDAGLPLTLHPGSRFNRIESVDFANGIRE